MYEKNLTEDLRLRLSKTDMDFLRELSNQRGISISECIRGIIGEYRRSIDVLDTLKNAMSIIKEHKEEGLSNGDTKTDINDKL
jgi:hypothetical protein